MTEIELNCQSLECPKPVLECKKLIEEQSPAEFCVLVDNDAAKENVSRFLTTKGYTVFTESQSNGVWKIKAVGSGVTQDCNCEVMTEKQIKRVDSRICVLLTTDLIGSGDDTLGAKLMKNFIATLPELDTELWRIVLLNGGVKLSTKDSPVIEELKKLENKGVSIIVCGTCLDHFEILEQKAVGETTNMLDVVTSLQLATKVIRP